MALVRLSTLLRGIVLGFCASAPVGPVGLLCIRRTLASGMSAGIFSGLGAALADYVAKVAKLKTVAVVDDRTAYGQGLASVFKKEAEKQGVKVVASEFTND